MKFQSVNQIKSQIDRTSRRVPDNAHRMRGRGEGQRGSARAGTKDAWSGTRKRSHRTRSRAVAPDLKAGRLHRGGRPTPRGSRIPPEQQGPVAPSEHSNNAGLPPVVQRAVTCCTGMQTSYFGLQRPTSNLRDLSPNCVSVRARSLFIRLYTPSPPLPLLCRRVRQNPERLCIFKCPSCGCAWPDARACQGMPCTPASPGTL